MIKSRACSVGDHIKCLGKYLCDCECHLVKAMKLACKIRDAESNKSVGILERKPNEWFVVYDPVTDSNLEIIGDPSMERITSPIQYTCQKLLMEYARSSDGLQRICSATLNGRSCSQSADHSGNHCDERGYWGYWTKDEKHEFIYNAPPSPSNTTQVGGTHYVKHGDFQPWDAWWHWKLNAFQGAIIKYVVRYRDKGGIEDLKKARHYIDKLIECEEQEKKK